MTRPVAKPPAPNRPQTLGALVIGGNYRGLTIARSLGRHRVPVWVITPPQERLVSLSRFTQRTLPWPEGSEAEQVSVLLDLADRHGLEGWLLLPTDDQFAALLSIFHASLSERFRVTTPPWEVMRWAYDKRLTYQLAAESGVDFPWTWQPSSEADLATVCCEFPVILKPAMKTQLNRFTEDKAWPAGDRETLLARYRVACALVLPEIVMVQEMVPGDGASQFSFTALCSEGQPLAWVTARRTRQYPIDFGHSSCFVETVDLVRSKKLQPACIYAESTGSLGGG
jgi:predicted ATP-grasp superfamily ATP-dependent carboligase